MKTAIIFEGPGFADQPEIVEALRFRNYHVIKSYIGLKGSLEIPDLAKSDLVLMRAPWTATPEESLIVRSLASRLKPEFARYQKEFMERKTLFLGIGRGALILLFMDWLAPWRADQVEWREAFSDKGPWLETEFLGSTQNFLTLVLGRALPYLEGEKTRDLAPVAWVDRQAVAWAKGENIFASLTDVFAYRERSQHHDFGYGDLMKYATQMEIMEMLLERRLMTV